MATLNLTKKDSGKLLNVTNGSEILVSLPENPTTGFRWQLDEFDQNILKSGESTFETGSNAVGAGGTRLLKLRVTNEGETKLRAKLWRQWEGDSSVIERFEVTIRVGH